MCDAPNGLPTDLVKDFGLDTIGLAAYGFDTSSRESFIRSEFGSLTCPRIYIASDPTNCEQVLGYLAVEFFRHTKESTDPQFWEQLVSRFPLFDQVLQTHGSLLLCTIAGIAISPQAQGKGLAKQMMNGFLEQVHGEIDMVIGISKNPAQLEVREKTCTPYEMTHFVGTRHQQNGHTPAFVHAVAALLAQKERARMYNPTQLMLEVDPSYLRPFSPEILQDIDNPRYSKVRPLIEAERRSPGLSLAYPLIGVGNHLLSLISQI